MTRFARLRRSLEELFPERHLYVRSGGEMRGYVLTTGKQLTAAAVVTLCALWMGICTAAMMVNAMALSATDQELARMQAKSERWVADREARLNSAVAQLNAANGSIDTLATTVEKRHAALALLLTDVKGAPGLTQALAPSIRQAARTPWRPRPCAASNWSAPARSA
jgi:type VI protein secretion system component VasK